MKRVGLIVIVAIMMVLPAGLFAGGNIEERVVETGFKDTVEITNSEIKVGVTYEHSGGFTYAYLDFPFWEGASRETYGIVRVQNGTDISYYDVLKGNKLSGTGYDVVYNSATGLTAIVLTEESGNMFYNLSNYMMTTGTYTNFDAVDSFQDNTLEPNPLKAEAKSICLKWNEYEQPLEFDLLLVNRTRSEYNRYTFTVDTEFFKGERTLFAGEVSYSYEKKAVSFLGNMLGSDFIDYFDQFSNTYNATEIPWSMFDETDFSNEEKIVLNAGKADLKRKFSEHLSGAGVNSSSNTFPFIETEEMFEGIYGTERNIYIKTYLEYIYYKEKPILSKLYEDIIIDMGRNDSQFNFGEAEAWKTRNTLDYARGSELARNALRYYTWGVEYTPFEGYEHVMLRRSMNGVFDSLPENAEGRKIWTDIEGIDTYREKNYITSPVYNASEFPINTIYAQIGAEVNGGDGFASNYPVSDKVTVNFGLKEGDTINLNRIDIWTSSNLAWEGGRITPHVWKIYLGENENNNILRSGTSQLIETTETSTITRLSDEVVGQNILQNVQLNRDTASGLATGYTFTKREHIQGFMLTRGEAAALSNPIEEWPTSGSDTEWISVYGMLKDEDDNKTWYKLQSTEYIEVVVDNPSECWTFYPQTNNRKPGYGIWSDYFSKNNTELSISYIILKNGIESDGIMVVDYSGNTYFNISEMAVFSENPLGMLDYENKPEVSPFEIYPADIAGVYFPDDLNTNRADELLINGNIETALIVDSNIKDKLKVEFGTGNISIGSVVLWQKDGTVSSVWNTPTLVYGDAGIEDSSNFTNLANIHMGNPEVETSLTDVIDTPYWSIKDSTITLDIGNPIPYAPSGIDSPRTFLYKMEEQIEARNKAFGVDNETPLAKGTAGFISYNRGYTDDSTGTNKPFKPGYYKNNGIGGYDEDFRFENTAGVDGIGILQGALAMMNGIEFNSYDAIDLLAPIDSYYSMKSVNSGSFGLEDDGKPIFTPVAGNNLEEQIPRITIEDIERNTVIVPDVKEIQEGDIIVRVDKNRNMHIGVVVGYLGDKPVPGDDDYNDFNVWMNNTLVISTRPGFRMANLGVWGNPAGMFGGFTDVPYEYLARRFVVVPNGTSVTWEDSLELMDKVHYQRYTHYIEEGRIPWGSESLTGDDRYKDFMSSDSGKYVDYRELPPTSYYTNILNQTLFNPIADGLDINQIRPTSFTGWRELDDLHGPIKYHRGADFKPKEIVAGTDLSVGIETNIEILAPESGKFWVKNMTADSLYLQIDDNNALFLELYNETYFGDVGVLITNPEDPQSGRIYLFMHLFYEVGDPTYGNPITVNQGDSLGMNMGGHSDPPVPPHIHMEIYEFFGDYNLQKTENEIISRQTNYNLDHSPTFTLTEVKENLKWQRIDPRTVFNQNLLIEIDDYNDGTNALIEILQNLPAPYVEYRLGITDEALKEKFLPWTYWKKVTEE